VLLLAESRGDDAFASMRESCPDSAAGWSFHATAEPTAVVASRADRTASLLLVAGRQIATRERLEVLALGTTGDYPDGRGLHETIEAVLAGGALAVMPWGFGKWWLGRGRLVADCVRRYRGRGFWLGDNGGRPRGPRRPRLLDEAAKAGVWTLPGSDPLPFPSQAARVGRYGLLLPGALGGATPARDVVTRLAAATAQPPIYGPLASPLAFVRWQLGLRLRGLPRVDRRGGAA
jgi:hypothetical protein